VEQQLAAMTLDVASELVHYVPPFQRCRWISIDSYLYYRSGIKNSSRSSIPTFPERLSTLLIAGWPRQLISSECKYACAERPRVVIEVIPAGNDVNLPGLATTETLTRHVNLNYFSEAVSWEGEARRMPIPGGSRANRKQSTMKRNAPQFSHLRLVGLEDAEVNA
jgi:hypothetical protein